MKKNKTERGVSALVANLQAKPVKFGRGAVSSSYRYGAAGRVRHPRSAMVASYACFARRSSEFAKTEIDRFPGPIMPRFAVDVRADLIALVSR
ncbi:hypothetical protein [Bradyrhizobium yuanmingense]|uniref:hypothetical protein n=1 Tax=Bradyrhizobium yuanmingense TaxID=108015 RepID=UPI0023B9F623|nr:hypothetical protein [Bradyrhizobium yuanmingense]MDF0494254.1 hypothetical protein [Bradyrhizobium yuanmingense]